ncbi:MAG: xylulokinase [Clostridiales bacterium]|jgi:xylulokinase|nr:xylulokinase [Clostridiales bacterium]
MYLLGCDIGTSGTKTVLFDEAGNSLAAAVSEYPMYQPQNGWAEQDPEDWWKAVCETIKAVIAKSGIGPENIKGIGLSGQMHGAVLLDRENKVLRKAIIWCDQRSSYECEEITELIGREKIIQITANPVLTGFTAAKVRWVRNNEPQIYEKIAKILLPKDYIRFRLTGIFATEVSDASGMQYMNIPNRCWSDEILDKIDVSKNWLADLYESYEISSEVNGAGAMETGLKAGTPVCGGAGDQAAGAIGNGIVKPGIISSTIGTSGVVFAHSNTVKIDSLGRVHTFCHAVPGAWHMMGVTQGAGLSLKWFRDNFCRDEKDVAQYLDTDPYVIMDREADKIPAGCDNLIYLPYLMGERTPHLDPDCRGVFFGLSAMHTKIHMQRSVMEGVCYSLLDCFNILKEMGIKPMETRASGGGGRSFLWRQMQADMFDTDIVTINSSEGGALGVALLAGVGTGIYKNIQEACETVIKTVGRTKPNPENRGAYLKNYEIYKELYPALKNSFKKLK